MHNHVTMKEPQAWFQGLTDQYREPEVMGQLNRPLIRSWIICFEPDYNITIIWNRDRCSLDWIFKIQINWHTVNSGRFRTPIVSFLLIEIASKMVRLIFYTFV